VSSPQHPNRRTSTCTVFSRLLLHPRVLDVITNILRATLTGRTTATNPTAPCLIVYLPTGLTTADKPNARLFTSDYIIDFGYTLKHTSLSLPRYQQNRLYRCPSCQAIPVRRPLAAHGYSLTSRVCSPSLTRTHPSSSRSITPPAHTMPSASGPGAGWMRS
jgi:hypothetical protein